MQSNHPIPQNVTQYQFRLVGDMTLKQFLELAGGLLLAYLFYSSNLIFIFKYPLALGSIFLGIALAFFPIEDRPLDTWIINFIRAIYGPTRFTWTKTHLIPPLFDFTSAPATVNNNLTTKTIKAPNIAPTTAPIQQDLTPSEKTRLLELDQLLRGQPISVPPASTTQSPKPQIHKLSPQTVTQPPLSPPSSPTLTKPVQAAPPTPSPTLQINSVKTTSINPTSEVKHISLPATPTIPNLVSGLVLSSSGELVENAIVELTDPSGIPQRAVKSNALGQFAINTPLGNGEYHLQVESDHHIFPAISLNLTGSIFAPIKVQANASR